MSINISLFNSSLWNTLWIPLVITVVVEFIVILIVGNKRNNKYLKLAIASLPLNLFSNIMMNLVLTLYLVDYYWIALVILEVLVVLIEAFYYQLLTKNYKVSLFVSFAANLVSLIIGLLIV